MNITTISQLDSWMTDHCIKNTFTPGNRYVTDEGAGLEKVGDLFVWYYSERGMRSNDQYFATELDAVKFVYEYVRKDKNANSHLVGYLTEHKLKGELIDELIRRNIKYWNDQIPAGITNKTFRIYVYRCDIKKVSDLVEKYINKD